MCYFFYLFFLIITFLGKCQTKVTHALAIAISVGLDPPTPWQKKQILLVGL